ncbi:hypothetical protein PAXRUDRAFT_315099 [Paxillus rubicundulus Ve08.2h10]|uniref:Uncharacterized protein n=1 Tax=Paxillus rubicundulus Ve08.2h10 TaxID=930991 RepID=A0A0D0DMY2_9AGAM|nr:hypothetical protein PAXRUDRAFT_315099 [Paxillus rubicundulus Ve08.2h10]
MFFFSRLQYAYVPLEFFYNYTSRTKTNPSMYHITVNQYPSIISRYIAINHIAHWCICQGGLVIDVRSPRPELARSYTLPISDLTKVLSELNHLNFHVMTCSPPSHKVLEEPEPRLVRARP